MICKFVMPKRVYLFHEREPQTIEVSMVYDGGKHYYLSEL